MKRTHYSIAIFVAVLVALAAGSSVLQRRAAVEAAGVQAPRFEVDPMWPKPLPNHWVIGATIGVAADANDRIWIIHRATSLEPKEQYLKANPPAADCCAAAPPILEFNEAGDLIGHWGLSSGEAGEGYVWPASNHGIDVDYKGNVWIGGNGRGGQSRPASMPKDESKMGGAGPVHDSMVLKFTQSGKFLMQIGKPNSGRGSNDPENLRLPAKTLVDPKTNELYVADGYGNRRVIVFDADTGKYKRHWGAYGHKPDDAQLLPYNPDDPVAQQFRTPVHGIALANDGMLYVCDRTNDRVQAFKTDGTFVKEVIIERNTRGDGSTFDVALSRDPQQRFLYVADGSNMKVHILQRDTLQILTSFGDGGRQPGEFYAVHSIATDSKGNIFTTETYRGQRVQKFLYRGLGPVTKKDQGVVWPKTPKG